MNRKIKFRGKRLDNGEWVYGSLLIGEPPLQCFSSEEDRSNKYYIVKSGFADWNMPRPWETYEVDGSTVGQFTGAIDCTGKEIYEGDVDVSDEDAPLLITYDSKNCYFGITYVGSEYDCDNIIYWNICNIGGNIYDNPELLK